MANQGTHLSAMIFSRPILLKLVDTHTSGCCLRGRKVIGVDGHTTGAEVKLDIFMPPASVAKGVRKLDRNRAIMCLIEG